MSYGTIYVASVAMGAKDEHTLKAFLEAEAYEGPALIIAYSHCIAHGINMTTAMQNQKAAVQCGQWLLYRYQSRTRRSRRESASARFLAAADEGGRVPGAREPLHDARQERPESAKQLFAEAQRDADARWQRYQRLAAGNSKTRKENPHESATNYLGMTAHADRPVGIATQRRPRQHQAHGRRRGGRGGLLFALRRADPARTIRVASTASRRARRAIPSR